MPSNQLNEKENKKYEAIVQQTAVYYFIEIDEIECSKNVALLFTSCEMYLVTERAMKLFDDTYFT